MTIFYILLAIVLVLALIYRNLYLRVATHIPDTFPIAENRQQINHQQKVVVCLGDSNTHGNVSYNWVDDLSRQCKDFYFVNAGKNSDLTYTLLTRINDVIACKPDYINILIGTNDVNATMSQKMTKRYQDLKRIDTATTPSFEEFQQNFREIIQILKTSTSAKISVMSLPVMGEDLHHEANRKADKYSEFIKELAQQENIMYLPVREAQKQYLIQHPNQLKHTFEETYKLLNISVILHVIFKKDWDYVTRLHGYQLTPDNLHQNSIAGGMIRDLLKNFLLK